MDKPRWESWTMAAQKDKRTGRLAIKIGAWREPGEILAIKLPDRTEAEAQLAEYLRNDVCYPLIDTSKPYKPVRGYLDEEYHVIVVICEPIPGDPQEILLKHMQKGRQ